MVRKPISKAVAGVALFAALGAAAFVVWRRAREPVTAVSAATERSTSTLTRWGSGLPHAGQWRHGFVVVDFDGDGQLDIVHGPARKSPNRSPQIFSGDGNGHFTLQTRFSFPKLPFDYGAVAVADFDGDGALDLALASHLVGIAVLVRRGDAFEPYATELGLLGGDTAAGGRPLAGFSSRAIKVVDWDGDGRPDLVASSDGPHPFAALHGAVRSRRGIVVLRAIAGGFEPIFPATDVAGFGDSLAVGDVDPGPGLEIVAAANVVNSKHLLYRRGAAGLELVELPRAPEQRTVRTVAIAHGRTNTYVLLGGLATGAQGLEGSLDVVSSDSSQPVRRLVHGEPLSAVSSIGVGDLDADGASDVLVGEESGRLRRFELEESGFALREVMQPPSELAGCTAFGIEFANLDRRAGDEVVVSYAGDDEDCSTQGGIEVYHLTP